MAILAGVDVDGATGAMEDVGADTAEATTVRYCLRSTGLVR
jgi:hypothetical protein